MTWKFKYNRQKLWTDKFFALFETKNASQAGNKFGASQTFDLTCSPERWPQNWSLGGQTHMSAGLCLHQQRCQPHPQQHIHFERECLSVGGSLKLCSLVSGFQEGRINRILQKWQKCILVPGIILIAGWFSGAFLPSCCSWLWGGGTVGTMQKVFSSGGSTQAKVLRSAWVESTLLSWLLQGATRAASSNSSVVSSVLRKE